MNRNVSRFWYADGLADIVGTGVRPTYLLGTVYPTGRWFYFPVAFTIKTCIALLLLLPLALLTRMLYRKHPCAMLFLLLPSLAFFAISLTSGLNIGIRHILPVYPFFIVIAAAGACTLAQKYRVFFYALVVLLLFHASTAIRTAPNYIAFANDLWGGTNNTYRLLHSSNVDMGQNLKIIEEYLKKEDIKHPWPRAELQIFDIERGKRLSVRIPDEDEQSLLSLSWLSDGSELTFLRALRRGGSMALIGANPETGETRVVLREEDPRGILGALFFNESNLLYTPVVVPLQRYWHTDSYEKRNGRWQVVWSQATGIR